MSIFKSGGERKMVKNSKFRKPWIVLVLLITGSIFPQRSQAQFVIADVIKLVAKKVINALDLAVQKAQNKTIVLQNAEKELENNMAKLQLDGIVDWVDKARKLYADYYRELMQVKQTISNYDKVREIIVKQSQIVSEYQRGFALFKQDRHFTPTEINQLYWVYSDILQQSLDNMNEMLLVVGAFTTQMDDAARLVMIEKADQKITKNQIDLNAFNQANIRLSLDRSRDENDVQTVKDLYGLP